MEEAANKLMNAATRAANNSRVVSVCLVGSFVALTTRAWKQQNKIDALEAEKASLLKSNKATKQTMWDWKQQLYAEADSDSDSAIVPLARLQAIYGEAPIAIAAKQDPEAVGGKFVV